MLYRYKHTPFLRETKNSSSIQLNLDLRSAPRDLGNWLVISRVRYIGVLFHTFTINGLMKIVRYTEDFVIQRFVKSRFHCKIFINEATTTKKLFFS